MEQNQNKEENPAPIPNYDPSKAMDSKREVENSPDEKTDEDLPGYPHYPAREDILNQGDDYIREDVGMENLASSANDTGVSQRFHADTDQDLAKESITPVTAADTNTNGETDQDSSSGTD